jgi:MoxR-like ATPase
MSLSYDYTYTSDAKYQPPQEGAKDDQGRLYYPYIPSDDLKQAVNLAIALQRPLLLEGKPGCGKTRLAGAIAYELTQKHFKKRGKPAQQWWDYQIWNVKSNSRARDGLYTYDAVARLRDAQLMGSDPQRLQEYLGKDESLRLKERLGDRTQYREFGPLGKALLNQQRRSVVLIDEIDKADSDFPNDLLMELDTLGFEILETGEKVVPPEEKPIIIITSNREKPLPDPFLRRCLYFYVEFPDDKQLQEIIQRRFGRMNIQGKELVQRTVKEFGEIRDLLEDRPGSRPPGTSEILEFLTALLQNTDQIEKAFEDLEHLAERLPLLGILLKTRQDQQIYQGAKRKSNA